MTDNVVIEERPKTLTSEMALAVAREIAGNMKKAGLIGQDENIEDYAADIAKHGRRFMDGYELARDLEHNCFWDCNFQMAEELDSFSSLASSEIHKAQKEWATRNHIVPPFPIGTRIKTKSGDHGIIDAISEYHPAAFTIAIDGDEQAAPPTNRRLIVNFEDARAALKENE